MAFLQIHFTNNKKANASRQSMLLMACEATPENEFELCIGIRLELSIGITLESVVVFTYNWVCVLATVSTVGGVVIFDSKSVIGLSLTTSLSFSLSINGVVTGIGISKCCDLS